MDIRSGTTADDIWYCNQRYQGGKVCNTPFLRESEVKSAFEAILEQRGGADAKYSDELWRELVETATVYADKTISFHLTDGSEAKVALR